MNTLCHSDWLEAHTVYLDESDLYQKCRTRKSLEEEIENLRKEVKYAKECSEK